MCRVCLKRPEIPDEQHGRCEVCVKSGRVAYRFRLGPGRGTPLQVKAGELSPRALRQKWRDQISGFSGHLATKQHLGLHELEMLVTRDRLDTLRTSPDLSGRDTDVLAALQAAAERTDAGW